MGASENIQHKEHNTESNTFKSVGSTYEDTICYIISVGTFSGVSLFSQISLNPLTSLTKQLINQENNSAYLIIKIINKQ